MLYMSTNAHTHVRGITPHHLSAQSSGSAGSAMADHCRRLP